MSDYFNALAKVQCDGIRVLAIRKLLKIRAMRLQYAAHHVYERTQWLNFFRKFVFLRPLSEVEVRARLDKKNHYEWRNVKYGSYYTKKETKKLLKLCRHSWDGYMYITDEALSDLKSVPSFYY